MKKITKIIKTTDTRYICENCGKEHPAEYNIMKCPICGKDTCLYCSKSIYILSDKPLGVYDMNLDTHSTQELYICKNCMPKQMEKLEDRYIKELEKLVKEFNKQVKQLNAEYKEAIKLGNSYQRERRITNND